MSAGGDKQIRFTFAVDQRSVEVARGAIRQLTSEVKILVETMSRAGSSMQGLGGGLLGGVSMKGGNVNASQQSTMKGGSVLTQGIAADAKALSTSAKVGSDAMRQMTSSVKSGLTDQISAIQRLKSELNTLDNAYRKMGGGINWGSNRGGMGAERGSNRLDARDTYNRMAEAEISHATATAANTYSSIGPNQKIVNRGGIDMVVDTDGPGLWSRMKTRGDAALSGAGAMMSRGAGLAGAGAGVFYAGVSAYDASVNAPRELRSETANFGLWQMMNNQRQRAEVNSAYGALGWKVKNDLVARFAMGRIGLGGPVGTVSEGREHLLTEANNLQTSVLGGAKDTSTRLWNRYTQWGANFRHGIAPSVFDAADPANNIPQGESNKLGHDKAQALAAMPGKLAGLTNERYDNAVKQISVSDQNYLNQLSSTFQSRLSAQSAARTTNAALSGMGTVFSADEVNSMRAQLGQVAGGQFMGRAASILGLQAGGMNGAAGIYGSAAQFGGGDAFMKSIASASSMTGQKGYVDVAASGQIGQMIAQEMMMNGRATPRAMQGMLGATGAMGGNLLAAGQIQRGYGQAGAVGAGATSPMQMALNTIAASQMSSSLYGGQYLQSLTPAEEMDVMRGGAVPGQFGGDAKAGGNIAAYVNQRNARSFFGYRRGKGAGADADALVDEIRSSGDFYGTAKSHITGGSSAERSASLKALAYTLGKAQAAGRGKFGSGDIAVSQAMEMIELAKNPEIIATITGGHVGATGDKMSRAEKKRQDQLLEEAEKGMHKLYADHPEYFDKFTPEQLKAIGALDTVGSGNIDQAADAAAKALQALASSWRSEHGGSPTKGSAPSAPSKPSAKPSHHKK